MVYDQSETCMQRTQTEKIKSAIIMAGDTFLCVLLD